MEKFLTGCMMLWFLGVIGFPAVIGFRFIIAIAIEEPWDGPSAARAVLTSFLVGCSALVLGLVAVSQRANWSERKWKR